MDGGGEDSVTDIDPEREMLLICAGPRSPPLYVCEWRGVEVPSFNSATPSCTWGKVGEKSPGEQSWLGCVEA